MSEDRNWLIKIDVEGEDVHVHMRGGRLLSAYANGLAVAVGDLMATSLKADSTFLERKQQFKDEFWAAVEKTIDDAMAQDLHVETMGSGS